MTKDEYHGCGDEFRILFFKCLQPYLQDGKGLFAERLPQTAESMVQALLMQG